jgi:hypothetical protein
MVAVSIHYDFSGFDKFLHKWNRFIVKVDELGEEGIQNIADWINESAKMRAPKDTGALANSIRVEPKDKRRIDIRVYTENPAGVNYAYFQEFGFTPHRVAGMWMSGWLGRKGYSGSHWGTFKVAKYTPFLGPSIEAARPLITDIARGIVPGAAQSSGIGGI